MATAPLYFNGINGATGDYLLPPTTLVELTRVIRGEPNPQHLADLQRHAQRARNAHLGPKEGVDPKSLAESGWGVIFASADRKHTPAVKEALQPLLDLRCAQAGDRYREFTGRDGYRRGETKLEFLARHGAGPGPADPDRVPYYLLIVGTPQTVPYQFEYQLDVQYAVGRLHFNTLDEYAHYARSVVAAENGWVQLPRRAVFFGVQNLDDPATSRSATQLVAPLAQAVATDKPSWRVTRVAPGETKKARLLQLLHNETPALLFTASHGMGFPTGDSRQLPHQGALLCGDWPGPLLWRKEIPADFYLASDDIGDDARLLGMVSFHFACFGAGTPRLDEFSHFLVKQPTAIAPRAFVARLPQRLLSLPKGGALAVVGHVERVWGYSFEWPGAGRQLVTFQSVLKRMMEGHPVGSATEPVNARYAELYSDLSTELKEIDRGKTRNDQALAEMWIAGNDARSYVVVGDPAVRLCTTPDD